jgi:hypothetical protein
MVSRNGQIRVIKLTKGYSAIVDAEDYERINAHKWHVTIRDSDVRALRILSFSLRGRYYIKRKYIYMHHQVLRIDPQELSGKEIDHMNCNTLDNRKSNLRVITHAENMRNSRRFKWNRKGSNADLDHG